MFGIPLFCILGSLAVLFVVYNLFFSKAPPRLWGLVFLNVAIIAALYALAPQQLPVTLYKLSLVTLAALVAYWLDRALFPYARPDALLKAFSIGAPMLSNRDLAFNVACIRRAIIIGCAMLAMGLGA